MKHVVCYEFLLALFAFSGLYKGYPVLANLPIDLTLALGVSCVVTAVLMLLSRRVRLRRDQAILAEVGMLFFAWMVFTSTWSRDLGIAMHKATMMLPTVIVSFLGSVLVVSSSEQRCKRFIDFMVLLAILQAAITVAEFVTQRPISSLDMVSGDYLGAGQLIGMAWTAVYCRMVFERRTPRSWVVRGALLLFLGTAMMLLGGKQGIAGIMTVVGLSLVASSSLTGDVRQLRNVIAAIVLLVSVVTVSRYLAMDRGRDLPTAYRIVDALSSPGSSSSVQSRVGLMRQAYEGWLLRPIVGYGLGSFGPNTGRGSVRAYPHNIILEVLYEGGIVGLAALISLIGLSIRTFRRNRFVKDDALSASVFLMFVFATTTMMVSNTYADSRHFFVILGLLRVRYERETKLSPI